MKTVSTQLSLPGLVVQRRRYPVFMHHWDGGKASSLSALCDLNRPLSPGQDDQLLSIAPLERDGRGFVKYAENDGWKRFGKACSGP